MAQGRPLLTDESIKGIHYELSEKTSMTTTHDRTYQLDEFPPNRTVNRPEDENNGESTMKTDYSYKRISDPAMVSCPKLIFGSISDIFTSKFQK